MGRTAVAVVAIVVGACSSLPLAADHDGADAGEDVAPVSSHDAAARASCTSAADCVSGQICCAVNPCSSGSITTACQAGPCPETPCGPPVQLCDAAADCPEGDTCGPVAGGPSLPIMVCNAMTGDAATDAEGGTGSADSGTSDALGGG